jgi:hypothetical protein
MLLDPAEIWYNLHTAMDRVQRSAVIDAVSSGNANPAGARCGVPMIGRSRTGCHPDKTSLQRQEPTLPDGT